MGETEERAPKPKYVWKNVLRGRNPDTGRPYFDRVKVRVEDPTLPPEEPKTNLLTKEELDKQMAEKMAKDWDNATSKDGRPPIGGAQDD